MALKIKDFWQFVLASRLFSQSACEKWAVRSAQELGPERATEPKRVAEWLISQKVISRYQAQVLLAGNPGPFFYGEYRVYDRIEKGRLAGLFRAHHVSSRHPVLLQFLSGPMVQTPAGWQQLVGWVQAHLAAREPHLFRWFELCDQGNFKFLVIEDVRGKPWQDVFADGKSVATETAVRAIFDAATALLDLHQRGLVHGDVRPANLWNDPQGNTRLLRLAHELPGPLTAGTHELLLRADYLAPEFLHPEKVADRLTDIYALGCSAYQLLGGSVPFPEGDVATKLQRHASEPIRPLEAQRVPAELVQIVAYMMAKNPQVRFQSADVILDQLRPFLGETNPAWPAAPATWARFEEVLNQRPQPMMNPPVSAPAAEPVAISAPTPPAARVEFPSVAIGASPDGPEVAEIPIRIVTPEPGELRSKRPKKRKLLPLVVSVISALVVVAVVGIAVIMNSGSSTQASSQGTSASRVPTAASNSVPGPAPESSGPAGNTPAAASTAMSAGNAVVPDDGKLLWASPTAGHEIEFNFLPSGAQFVLFARPADLQANAEGGRLIKALGPGLELAMRQWEEATGLAWEQVESLLLSFHGGDEGTPRAAIVSRMREPLPAEPLLEKWGKPAPKVSGNLTTYEAGGWSYLLPPDSEDRVLVMCAPTEMADIVERQGAPPPDHRWIGRLRRVSDDQRHVTVFFTPQNLRSDLLRDGRTWSWGDVRRARDAVDWFLGDSTQAAMLSLHLGDASYLEMRVAGEIGRDRYTLANDLRNRLSDCPERVEALMVAVNPPPYWRAVAFRFPGMIRFLHEQTRIGVEGEHALLNAVLPLSAAHNLAFGSSMALLSSPGAVSAVATGGKPATPKTMDELLAYKMKVDIPQQDLVNALADIERSVNEEVRNLPVPFKIKMMGNDLKVDGITQNQKIVDFKLDNQTLADILTGLVRKANPDPAVKDASEPGQKLVWVVAPDPDDKARQAVIITTRAGAERDRYKLPAPFLAKP